MINRYIFLPILLFFLTAVNAQVPCDNILFTSNIADQSICAGDSVTLTASANVLPNNNLVISAVFDGPLSGGTPKGIELYAIKDISDLSLYGVGSANNGGGSDGQEFTFPAVSANAGDYIYLSSDSATFNQWFGFNAAYITSAVNINGDDAMELFYQSNVIDVFGDINVDGNGEPWEYMDGWAYRNSSTGPDGSVFSLSSWSFSGPNALDGESSNSTASSPIPIGTFVHPGTSPFNTYTIDVTASSAMDYTFAGSFTGADPAVSINLGDTLVFNVNAPSHPFWINTVQGTGSANGVAVANNGTNSGTITWVPSTAGTYYYNCELHSMMTNTITVGPPAISYVWTNGVTNGVPFSPTASNQYIVTASDGSGCVLVDTVVVAVTTVDLGDTLSFCASDSLLLDAGAGYNYYSWNTGDTTQTIYASQSGDYAATVGNGLGWTSTDSIYLQELALPTVDAGIDLSVCQGDPVTLSGSGAINYSWDNGVVDGVTFSASNTTTYTVIGTDGNGCVSTDQVDVTVNALPTVDAGADTTICSGYQITLNGAGASSFSWDNGVADGAIFSPLSTATYTVTGTDGNGCINTDQVIVIVNSLPTVNGGLDIDVCIGDSIVLNGAGAVSYLWDNGVTDGVYFAPSFNNTYTVTGWDANSCINNDQVDVTVNPLPTVSAGADQTLCEGYPVTLSGSGVVSYSWDNGITDGVTFNSTATTTYTVTGTDANGCSNNDDVLITVTPAPNVVAIAAADTVCIDWESILLTSSPIGGIFSGSGVTDDRFYPLTAGLGTHQIVYSYTDSITGCTGTDSVTIVVLECTGVSINNTMVIGMYPNPTNGQFTLQMDRLVNGRVEITNNIGQVVIDKVITGTTMQFDLSTVSSRGVYFVKVYTAEGGLLKLQKILYQ